MKQRRVPNTISKRLRRKLRRSKDPFVLWLRCRKPAVYARLVRLWNYRFIQRLVSISPIDTPFFSMAPKVRRDALLDQWIIDPLPFYGTGTIEVKEEDRIK